MTGEELKNRAQQVLENEGLDHLTEPFGRCTLVIQRQQPDARRGEEGTPRRIFQVDLQGSSEDCALLRQHEVTLTNVLWQAALREPDNPHINLTFCGEGGHEEAIIG